MHKRRITLLAIFVYLLLASTVLAGGEVIFLCQEGLETDIDVERYLAGGGLQLPIGFAGRQKVQMGPAPPPYPEVHVWEKGIEQLGESSDDCDGIRLINSNLWVPNKKALVLWKIRIPQASLRVESEFERDLTVSLWVDWNRDEVWGKSEKMICENINIHDHFPTDEDYLEIQFLSWFWIPYDSEFFSSLGGAAHNYKKLWVRGVLSYDDPNPSPDGECLFGEVEDYLVTYYNYEDVQLK